MPKPQVQLFSVRRSSKLAMSSLSAFFFDLVAKARLLEDMPLGAGLVKSASCDAVVKANRYLLRCREFRQTAGIGILS
jgi:hypothetical protein